ncbi:hypothetical protein [Iodidimonas sp. SYSU 1G8]|uniref:hypothetical protein n=1 Tax=Iodidimonas sp. SYSU 1G8 TaxID=3133967 RepID=UPI0031FE7033
MARAALALTVLALAVRFAFPAGTMLEAPNESGALPKLIICTTTGVVTVSADSAFGVPGQDDASDHGKTAKAEQPCNFAALGAPLLAPTFTVLDAPALTASREPAFLPAFQRPGQGLVAPPPPATGPPATV